MPKYLDELRARLSTATDIRDIAPIKAKIATIEARLLSLPPHLSLETRDAIAMWEGQLELHAQRYGAEADFAAIKARIERLMASSTPAIQQKDAA